MSKKNIFIAFTFGVVMGASMTWLYLKKEYERMMNEEIDSIAASSETNNLHDEAITYENFVNQNKKNYFEEIKKNGYINYSECSEKDSAKTDIEPYIISPEEFGEYDDYNRISLTYYADGILADDCDELVDHIEETVGIDFFSHFGEYEDDSVFVRNDRTKTDYEILLDRRKYSDVTNKSPIPHKEEI